MESRYIITSFNIITILEVKFNLPLHCQALEWYVIGSSSIITYMDGKLWTNFEHKQTCRLVLESIHHLSILNVVNGYMVKLVWALYSCIRELQDWAIWPLLPHMQHPLKFLFSCARLLFRSLWFSFPPYGNNVICNFLFLLTKNQ